MDLSRVFLNRQLATSEQIGSVRVAHPGKRIDRALIDAGIVREDQALQALGDELGMRFMPLKEFSPDPVLLSRFPTTAIFKHEVLPIEGHNGRVTVAISDRSTSSHSMNCHRWAAVASILCWPAATRSSS